MPITSTTLRNYPNKIFVESGTCRGQGVIEALDAGFETIVSFEVMPELVKFAQQRVGENRKVNIVLGSSVNHMWEWIKNIDQPITFWLDAHASGGPTGYEKTINPILEELDIIKKHPIKTHCICVDDRRLFSSPDFFCMGEQTIKDKILEINPNYHFSYEDGFVPNDILVSTI